MPSLRNRDRDAVWHPCAQMRDYDFFPPLEVVGAEGGWLHLADGRRVFDGISSWWCKNLGHRHPRLIAALAAQAGCFEHVIAANVTHEPLVACAEQVLACANAVDPATPRLRDPATLTKAFFSDNGSTAVEVALKMAVQWQAQAGDPRRTGFAVLEHGYHGETVGALSVSDCDLYRRHYPGLLFDCTVLRGLPYRTGPEDPDWQDAGVEWPALVAQLASVAGTLAAVVVEPLLQGAGGMRLYSPDLLRRLRTWCDQHGVLLIADEIAAGWGRLGTWLACHQAGVLPDLAVLSKGLTAGVMPFAMTLTTERIYEGFLAEWADQRAFLHSNTYAGNPLGCALALAVMQVYQEQDLLVRVPATGAALRQGLAQLASSRPTMRAVRGLGMMAAVDLTRADGSPRAATDRYGWRVSRAAIERGAMLRCLGDTLYLFPPLNSSVSEIEGLVRVLGEAIDAVSSDPAAGR